MPLASFQSWGVDDDNQHPSLSLGYGERQKPPWAAKAWRDHEPRVYWATIKPGREKDAFPDLEYLAKYQWRVYIARDGAGLSVKLQPPA
jgi:hypothetical protein